MNDGLSDHVAHVYRFVRRMTRDVHLVEDLTQETFLRAWERCQDLKDPRAARAWLFRIAINLMNDEFRRGNTAIGKQAVLPDGLSSRGNSPDLTLEVKEDLEQALFLLDSLPDQQRMVLYLVAVEEFSLVEVCKILEINMSTTKANLSLARKRMREELAKRESR